MTIFLKRTLLEHLSTAARENTLTCAYSWLLSDNSELPLNERFAIISNLTGSCISECAEITTWTEWNDIDLLVKLDTSSGPHYVAVEHKIKSNESKNQLTNYGSKLAELRAPVTKLFLTLLGERPNGGDNWKPIS